MSIDEDLEKISLEKRLQFDSTTAGKIGSALHLAAEQRKLAIAIDVELSGHTLFSFLMRGATPDNWDWI